MASPPIKRSDQEITEIYYRESPMLYRVLFSYLKNRVDTEDALQETFFRLIRSGPVFENEAHERAWLFKVAVNIARKLLISPWLRHEDIDNYFDIAGPVEEDMTDVFEAVLALPVRLKAPVYLYYYEGLTGKEIADMLGRPESTVRNQLREARKKLREKLGDDFYEE